MTKNPYRRTQYACFITSLSTAATGNLPPLLFLTFRAAYGISFTLLGLLVLINFGTQLLFDLIFSFYSHKFNLAKSVKATPAIIAAGLVCYALLPQFLPGREYLGLVLGTVVFSVGTGLSEVLTSPTIAAIPSENSQRLMSALHSCYAWGVVFVVAVSTGFLFGVGTEYWMWLPLLFALIPFFAWLLFFGAKMPDLHTAPKTSKAAGLFANKGFLLCVICIFLGGASECTMAQWCSGYLEQAFAIPKVWGDLLGVALFGLTLGVGRTLYARLGKRILPVMLAGAIGASVCYLTAVFSPFPILGLVACALTGLCVSMLWPGSLLAMADRVPEGGVAAYAMMAAGGDLGASLVPQGVGIIADVVIASPAGSLFSGTPEQAGMKAGMAFASLFPILTAVVVGILLKTEPKQIAGTVPEGGNHQ